MPNYNGATVIGRCVDALLAAAAQCGDPGEIIIVDDASTDTSLDVLAGYGDRIRVVPLSANRGFSSACNAGFDVARGRVIFLFNNDVSVAPDIMTAALPALDAPDVFAASFLARDEHGAVRIGRVIPVFKKGLLKGNPDQSGTPQPGPTLFASGGGAAFCAQKLRDLGGFDERMNPFYWEDVDLSYRAWKRGWRVVFDPACRLLHPAHGVISDAFAQKQRDRVSRRNQLIFTWKNLGDSNMLAAHVLFLLLKILTSILTLKTHYIAAVMDALKQSGDIRDWKRNEKQYWKRTDAQIMELVLKQCFK